MSIPYQRVGYVLPIPILTIRFRRLAESTGTEPYDAVVDTGANLSASGDEFQGTVRAHRCRGDRL